MSLFCLGPPTPAHADTTMVQQIDADWERPIELRGPWAFYWQRLLSPEDFGNASNTPRADARVFLPGSWNTLTVDDEPLPPAGYATYHTTLRLPESRPDPLVLRIPMIYSAYRMFINGQPVADVGKVGRLPETERGDYGNRHVTLRQPPATLEIVVQVSNHSSRVAGFPQRLLLGTPEAIDTVNHRELLSNGALAGALLFTGISQLLIFALRRREYAYLLFGITVLLWGMRVIVAGQLLPAIGWHLPLPIARTFDGLLALGTGVTYLLFLATLFPRELPMRYVRWSLLLPIAYLPFVTFAPELLRSQAMGGFLHAMLLMMALTVLAVTRAWWKKREDAGLILFGCGAIVASALLQLYLFDRAGVKEAMASFGIVFAVGVHSMVLARRYHRALARSQHLEGALRRANHLKDEFLANTSHELRTPLHGMIGLAESLPHQSGEPLRQGLALITQSGRRLVRLVDDILDFTRLKYDDLTCTPCPTALEPTVHGVLATCRPLIGDRDIALKTAFAERLPPVHADPDRLHQILFNLIGNAIKFTDQGSVTVSAHQEGAYVAIAIEDTGIGMQAEEWQRLLRPYEQGIDSSTEGRGGMGLGLAITQRLLSLHGSKLEIASRPDQGCRVMFRLALGEGDSSPATQRTLDAALGLVEQEPARPSALCIPGEAPNGPTILVVDDDETARTVLVHQLTLQGYRVRQAVSGREALEEIARERPELVMLDVMMPDMSGLTVCAELREEYDPNALPVILVTARTRPMDAVEGLNVGANDYLTKPFHRIEMLARVEAQLRIHENEQMRWALNERASSIDPEPPCHDPRDTLVTLLNKSVQYWELQTGLSRADLAERSRLWTVTLDGSARKTRTLDRYLTVESLPKRPRWGVVCRTARFVMERLEDSIQIQELETLLMRLEAALVKH